MLENPGLTYSHRYTKSAAKYRTTSFGKKQKNPKTCLSHSYSSGKQEEGLIDVVGKARTLLPETQYLGTKTLELLPEEQRAGIPHQTPKLVRPAL